MNEKDHLHTTYRVFDVKVVSENEERVLIHSRQTGRSMWIDPAAVQLLFSCQRFKSLNTHSEDFVRQQKIRKRRKHKGIWGWISGMMYRMSGTREITPAVKSKEIEPFLKQLEEFAEEGYLVPESELCEELTRFSQKESLLPIPGSEKISVVGIPTCGRTQSLKRCLTSFIGNFNLHQRSPVILILDDSRSNDVQLENQAVLREIKQSYTGRICSMNRKQRQAFARSVARRVGVDPDLMDFALMGHSSCNRSEGGCRNAFLLLTRGQLALQTDDDTLCQSARPPRLRNGLRLTSTLVSDEYWFFQSYRDAVEAVNMTDVDHLSLHEELLGKSPQSLIASHLSNGSRLDIEKVHASFFKGLKTGEPRVRMSLPGPAGDTCLFSDLYRLFLQGESLERLLYPAEAYPWHLSTRQVIRSVTQPVISDITRCIGMNVAVDNRSLLPPFMPVQARCDGIFGDLMAVCFPEAYSGNIPWVIPHEPPEKRSRSVDDIFSLLGMIRVNDIVSTLILTLQNRMGDESDENLRSVGRVFKQLGEKPNRQFSDELRQIYTSVTKQRIKMTEQLLLRNMNMTEYWTDNIRRYMQVLGRSVRKTDFLIPADIDTPSLENREDFKHIVHLFGRLLYRWPDICQAMNRFSEDEIHKYVTHIEKKVPR